MKEGCGMRDGSTRGAAPGAAEQTPGPSAHGPSRMRERWRQLRYYAHEYYSLRTDRAEFDVGTRSRDRKVDSEFAPCALRGTI